MGYTILFILRQSFSLKRCEVFTVDFFSLDFLLIFFSITICPQWLPNSSISGLLTQSHFLLFFRVMVIRISTVFVRIAFSTKSSHCLLFLMREAISLIVSSNVTFDGSKSPKSKISLNLLFFLSFVKITGRLKKKH